MKKQFWKYVILFFVPVLLSYGLLEYSLLQIPLNYTHTAHYFDQEKENIEVATFGSSQMMKAVNPAYIEKKAINFGSTSQHHNLDFEILKQTFERLPNLKTVVFEVSYSHFELPHNSKDFWKNNVYYKYFDVNAFQRKPYFKDRFIYLAKPSIYTPLWVDHYITKNDTAKYNTFGFQINDLGGYFNNLNYNDNEINSIKNIEINTKPNNRLFEFNTTYFNEIITFAKEHNLNVVVVTIPMHNAYLKKRNPEILRRRNQYLNKIKDKPHVSLFLLEEDTISFKTKDFKNPNHLNANGAIKYTLKLNQFLNTLE